VWGPSKEANEVASQIFSGTVGVNDGYAAAFASVDNEMGGTQESGQGRRQGHYGMLKYTESQNITEQRLIPIRGPKFLTAKPYAAVMSALLLLGKKTKILR
ncbi:MAG: aldehyde dehydrogenase family protein, partial [Corynebacterium variabile]